MLDEQLIIATTCAKEGTDAAAMVEHPPTTAETVASNIKAAQAARAVIAARELVPDERSTRATGVSVFDAYSTNVVMSQCGRLSKGQKLRCNFDEPQHEPGCKCMGTACRHDNAIVFYCIYCDDVGPTFDQALQCEARCSGGVSNLFAVACKTSGSIQLDRWATRSSASLCRRRDAALGDTDCPQNVIDETIAECDEELVAIWHEVEACEKEMEGEL